MANDANVAFCLEQLAVIVSFISTIIFGRSIFFFFLHRELLFGELYTEGKKISYTRAHSGQRLNVRQG
jgi:hypothetical protein